MEEQLNRTDELMGMLISSLLKWRYQSERRTPAMKRLIRRYRDELALLAAEFPQIAELLDSEDYLNKIWEKAVFNVEYETQFHGKFPPKPVWTNEEIVTKVHFFPS